MLEKQIWKDIETHHSTIRHTEEKPHICDTCFGAFESAELYKEHKVYCSDGKPVVTLLEMENVLTKHENKVIASMKRKHAEENPHICDAYYGVFESKDLYNGHMLTCNKGKPDEQLKAESDKLGTDGYELHVSGTEIERFTNNEEKQYLCNVCQKTFSCEELWRNHSLNCSEKKPFVCNVENILEVQISQDIVKYESEIPSPRLEERTKKEEEKELGNVMRLREKEPESEERPYKCNQCEKTYKYTQNLNRHRLIHKGVKRYKCDQCGKKFRSQYYLNVHARSHTGEKPYSCHQCGNTFRSQQNLKNHSMAHTGEKPYKCEQCGAGFSRNKYLEKHVKIVHPTLGDDGYINIVPMPSTIEHTGKKPYQCNQCGKAFGQNNRLKSHLATHTGEKLYQCDQCDKTFAWKCSLHTHLTTHTGERHHCDQCDKSFSHLKTLTRHKRIHTGEKPYTCNDCDKSFMRMTYLKVHSLVHTEEKLS